MFFPLMRISTFFIFIWTNIFFSIGAEHSSDFLTNFLGIMCLMCVVLLSSIIHLPEISSKTFHLIICRDGGTRRGHTLPLNILAYKITLSQPVEWGQIMSQSIFDCPNQTINKLNLFSKL